MRSAATDRDGLTNARLTIIWRNLLWAAAYFVVARLSLLVSFPESKMTAVWLGSPIAIAAILRHGRSVAPGLYLGSLAATLSIGIAPLAALGLAVADLTEGLVAAYLLRQHREKAAYPLVSVEQVMAFVIIGALLSPISGAPIGTGSLVLEGTVPAGEFWRSVAIWWTGTAVGNLTLTPLLVAAAMIREPPIFRGRAAVAALCSIVVVTAVIFFDPNLAGPHHEALVFLIFPFVAWGAVILSTTALVATNFAMATLAVTGTALGKGPFAETGTPFDVWLLEAFVVAITIMSLMLRAAIEDRRRSIEQRSEAEIAAQVQAEFLARMSHEIRTPISGVLGMLELLSLTRLDTGQRETLEVARQSGRRCYASSTTCWTSRSCRPMPSSWSPRRRVLLP